LNAFKSELSNGSLMDIGVYCIHPMVQLFGKPKGLKANGILLETGVDGEGSVTFEYEDMEGIAIFSKITNSILPSEIQGEEGNIIIQNISVFDQVKLVLRDGSEEILTQTQVKENMCYEIIEFIRQIQNKDLETNHKMLQFSQEVMASMDEARKQMGVVYTAD
ncbi:MAG: oxidoreductase, partial [Vallitaleaceae bacterium]|nr:oxidoreductase [Vallitaleaceae bacterium]